MGGLDPAQRGPDLTQGVRTSPKGSGLLAWEPWTILGDPSCEYRGPALS
jgi:hypothetical protein